MDVPCHQVDLVLKHLSLKNFDPFYIIVVGFIYFLQGNSVYYDCNNMKESICYNVPGNRVFKTGDEKCFCIPWITVNCMFEITPSDLLYFFTSASKIVIICSVPTIVWNGIVSLLFLQKSVCLNCWPTTFYWHDTETSHKIFKKLMDQHILEFKCFCTLLKNVNSCSLICMSRFFNWFITKLYC